MRKILILCLLAFCFANGTAIRFAVMPCDGVDPEDRDYLAQVMVEVSKNALKALPQEDYEFIPYEKVNTEANAKAIYEGCKGIGGACVGDAGGKVNADYTTWCVLNNSSLTVKLYKLYGKVDLYTTLKPKFAVTKEDMAEIIRDELPNAIKEQIVNVIEKKKKSQETLCREKGADWAWDGKECKLKDDIASRECTAEKDKSGNSINTWIDGKCINKAKLACDNNPDQKWDAGVCKDLAQYECEHREDNEDYTWDENKRVCKSLTKAEREKALKQEHIDTGIKPKESSKVGFWAGIGLEALGAAALGFAIYENNETKKAYDKYSESGQDSYYYEKNWKDADNSRSNRNMFYVIGGVLLASGIGVHIWF